VHGRQFSLRRAFSNLIADAIKHGGGTDISLAARCRLQASGLGQRWRATRRNGGVRAMPASITPIGQSAAPTGSASK